MRITELAKESTTAPLMPDGSRLNVVVVAAANWPALPVTTCVVIRLRGRKELFAGFIVENRLSSYFAPGLRLRQVLGEEQHVFKRRAIEELGRYEVTPAAVN